ncbi:MAG: SLBB domain-containing protein, partial [Nitrospiraceae bacterium]
SGTLIPGQPIVTNPTALLPNVPAQTPCPTPPLPDLTTDSTMPTLNDYWPMEPTALLPSSVEQRMRQEQEIREERQDQALVEKENRHRQHRDQMERDERGLPQVDIAPLAGMSDTARSTRDAPAAQRDRQEDRQRDRQRGQTPSTADRLRAQDFTTEEAFAQFSVLQGVRSRLKQFGYDFFDAQAGTFTSVQDAPVGPDYVIGPQDSLSVHIWNVPDQNINRSYIAPVERDGMIVIPQVGAIPVGGLTFSQAERAIRARLGSLLKRFDVHVAMARLRTIKIFVIGEVVRPGAYEISSLATASNALYAACGPAKGGSLRQIRVVREGKTIGGLDFYDFLLSGDRTQDRRLQSGDVVIVPPLGPVAAIGGAVKRAAIYELRPDSRLADLFSLAGGLTSVADHQRCHVFRVESGNGRIMVDVDLRQPARPGSDQPKGHSLGMDFPLQDGDYVRVAALPTQVANVVSLAGSVKSPGPYEFRPGMRVRDLLTPDQMVIDAYVDRAELIRTDLATYQTKVIQFSPKALFEGSETDNPPLQRLDQIVVASQVRPPNLILIEGEVKRPGYFTIEIGETLSSVLKRAGAFTPNAFPQGMVLTRESVKRRQRTELERFISTERQRLAAQSAGVAAGAVGISGVAAASPAAEQQVLGLRLQQLEAVVSRVELGRVVVRMDSIETLVGTEDDIKMEAHDRILIPQSPQTVSVIGSVKTPNTVVYRQGLRLEDYVRQAGGMTEEANSKEVYVMRANGTTESAYVRIKDMQPGDTIVVPQKVEVKTPQLALWSSVASIVGSVALAAAGIAVIGR